MPSLLDLPRELRDDIIELVLSSKRDAPSAIATAVQIRLKRSSPWAPIETPEQRQAQRTLEGFPLEQSGYISNSLPLVLVNHQLSSETKSAINRLFSIPSYSLDVMFFNGKDLWSTWLCVPVVAKQVDRLDITLRVCSSEETTASSSSRSIPDWSVFSVIKKILKCGPLGPGTTCADNQFSVKTLTVNCVDGNTTSSNASYERLDGPRILASSTYYLMTRLVNLTGHTYNGARLLLERIGVIRFSADGELHREINMSEELFYLRCYRVRLNHSMRLPEEYLLNFWTWKRATMKKRKERGLPVIDVPVEDEERRALAWSQERMLKPGVHTDL